MPDGSRTHDLWLRKPTLYPAELRALDVFILAYHSSAGYKINLTNKRFKLSLNTLW